MHPDPRAVTSTWHQRQWVPRAPISHVRALGRPRQSRGFQRRHHAGRM